MDRDAALGRQDVDGATAVRHHLVEVQIHRPERIAAGVGARLIGAGILIGIVASFALQRLVSSLLFGVTAADSASGIAVTVLAVVALIACYLPALRATRVSPLKALRYE